MITSCIEAAFAAAITSSSVAAGRPYRILYAIVSAPKSTKRSPQESAKHGKGNHNHKSVRAVGNRMTLTQITTRISPLSVPLNKAVSCVEVPRKKCRSIAQVWSEYRQEKTLNIDIKRQLHADRVIGQNKPVGQCSLPVSKKQA